MTLPLPLLKIPNIAMRNDVQVSKENIGYRYLPTIDAPATNISVRGTALSQSSKIKDSIKLNTIVVVFMLIKHFTPRLWKSNGEARRAFWGYHSRNGSLSYYLHVSSCMGLFRPDLTGSHQMTSSIKKQKKGRA